MNEPQDHYVYVICRIDNGVMKAPVKIGMASSPKKRLKGLQTSSPFKIHQVVCFGCPNKEIARELERSFHQVKRKHRLHGEWFDLEPVMAVHLLCIAYRAMLLNTAPANLHDDALAFSGVLQAENRFGLAAPAMRQ